MAKSRTKKLTGARTHTIETRIFLTEELRDYLDGFNKKYNTMVRCCWHMLKEDNTWKTSSLRTVLAERYDVSARVPNTIIQDIKGRQSALLELKKLQLEEKENKLKTLKKKIDSKKKFINKLKPKITANDYKEWQLIKYRKSKKALYEMQNKYNRNKQLIETERAKSEKELLNMCFGSKNYFKKQYNLKENNLKNHAEWKKEFINRRDCGFTIQGSANEANGNNNCRMFYDEKKDNFVLYLRKENLKFQRKKGRNKIGLLNNKDDYLKIENLDFKYQKDILKKIVCSYEANSTDIKYPLTYHFKKRKEKWYLQVSIAIEPTKIVTNSFEGVIGIDFNEGFLELTETNAIGNMVNQYHFDYKNHGTSKQAQNEMGEIIKSISEIAYRTGKDIVIEDLDFQKVKFQTYKGKTKKGKNYNRMLHALDYSRYIQMLESRCFRFGIGLFKVNPAYTSVIGERKYNKQKKLTTHQSASYVIARRGQGFKERKFSKYTKYIKITKVI